MSSKLFPKEKQLYAEKHVVCMFLQTGKFL